MSDEVTIEVLKCLQCKELGLEIGGRLVTQAGCGPWKVEHVWTVNLANLIEDLQEVYSERQG